MAVNVNGSNFINPLVSIQNELDTKALNAQIFDITTTLEWLNCSFNAAGTYSFVTSTGTATIYVYDSSMNLINEITATTASSNVSIASAPGRWHAKGDTSLDLTINKVNPKITTDGGTLALDSLGSGNYAQTSGGSAGNYTAGQYAHVVVVGGGGGGGGTGYHGGFQYNNGGAGGAGGISFNNTAFALTGTYSLTAGTGGARGNQGANWGFSGNAGAAGNASTGFTFTSNGGSGGNGGGGNLNSPGSVGAQGTPTGTPDTGIFKPTTTAKIGYGGGGAGGVSAEGNPGQAGRILVLKWTP